MKYPSYLNLSRTELKQRAIQVRSILKSCTICPRNCKINRLKEEKGFCRLGSKAIVSSWHPHFGEEACLVGVGGSGTIFFAHCNLACVYCQNFDISQIGIGSEMSKEELACAMLDLQNQGCHNINFVTPTPVVPQILEALPYALKNGLKIPLVYNTNAYDSVKTLKLLDGIVDIYMPDAKYADTEIAKKYSLVPDYPKIMKRAIKEMHRQVGDLEIDKGGVARRGLLVRHLVLPEKLSGTEKIMRFICNEISENTYVNIMAQYRPEYKADKFPPLTRSVTNKEFQKAIEIAKRVGLKRIYM